MLEDVGGTAAALAFMAGAMYVTVKEIVAPLIQRKRNGPNGLPDIIKRLD